MRVNKVVLVRIKYVRLVTERPVEQGAGATRKERTAPKKKKKQATETQERQSHSILFEKNHLRCLVQCARAHYHRAHIRSSRSIPTPTAIAPQKVKFSRLHNRDIIPLFNVDRGYAVTERTIINTFHTTWVTVDPQYLSKVKLSIPRVKIFLGSM